MHALMKRRESWAILHINRVMPDDQEYWFRYILAAVHGRLEERAAFKLQIAYRKEVFNRYQSVRLGPSSIMTLKHRFFH
jgi:hypothetical protein